MPVSNWGSLNALLNDALKVIVPLPKATPPPTQGYNELNAAMDLVLFEDAMSHICKVTHKSHPRATSYNSRSTEPWNLPEPIFSWLVLEEVESSHSPVWPPTFPPWRCSR